MNDAMHVIRRILQPAPADRRLAARRRLQTTILGLREPPLGCEVESHIRNDKKDFLALAPPRGHPTAGRRILSKEANELMN